MVFSVVELCPEFELAAMLFDNVEEDGDDDADKDWQNRGDNENYDAGIIRIF